MRLLDIARRIIEASQDDDDYVSIGFGRFKEKDSVDDPTAPTFKKDDSGAFIPAKGGDDEKGDDKGGEEKPKPSGKGLGKGDFERDFDDSEPEDKPFGGDTGKDADYEDEEKDESIIINGKKYRPIKESIIHPFKKTYKRIRGK